VIRILIMRTQKHGAASAPQRMVWPCAVPTILPGSGRPRDCLGSSICRFSARHDTAYNQPYLKSNNKSNNDANNCWNNDRYDFANNARYS
jgi:hypothetical protein